jgi:hypothetical protein
MGPTIAFLPNVHFAGSNPRGDGIVANRAPVAVSTEVLDIRVADPHHAMTFFRDTAAQLNFISIIRKVLVESANLLPQTAPDEEGETPNPRHIRNDGFLALGQQILCERAYLIVIPGRA